MVCEASAADELEAGVEVMAEGLAVVELAPVWRTVFVGVSLSVSSDCIDAPLFAQH